MFIRALSLMAVVLLTGMALAQPGSTASSPAQTAAVWPAKDQGVVLKNFKFGSGESLPELKLHYLTLGTPHRNAAGHVDNAVLLLHGTGGNAHSLLNPLFSNVLFVPGGRPRHHEILPHPARRHRPRRKLEALRRPARALSRLRLRRHGAQPAHDARRDEDRPPAPDPRHLDGLHAELRLGRNLSWLHGRAGAVRLPAGADRRPQPHDALHGHPGHQAGSGLDGRRVQDRAARRPAHRQRNAS